MRCRARTPAICLLCGLAGLAGSPVVALGNGASPAEASGALSPLGGPLVSSGSPVEGEELQAAREAKLASPAAVAEREASRTKFEHLNAEQAERVAGEAFPVVVDEAAGGPPRLPVGQSIVGFPSDYAAQLALPEGKHGVIESSVPIALETSPGQRMPVDLSLSEVGDAFEPKVPLVGVWVPRRLGEGVALGGVGVSFTPVDAQGSPLGGSEGVVDGASVFYANTLTDADVLVKPTTGGFEADTLLRSVDSPEQLSFRVGLPEGASLAQAGGSSGAVQVVKEGVTLAGIAAPSAQDAEGTDVPVSMSVAGDTLTLSVSDRAGGYRYPIEVDPTVTDNKLLTEFGEASNWREEPAPPSPFSFVEKFVGNGSSDNQLEDHDSGAPYARGESGAMAYETQGESHIYEFHSTSMASNSGANIENKLFISSPGKGVEREVVLGSSYPWTEEKLCVESGCATGKVEAANEHNGAEFKQTATNAGSEFSSTMREDWIYILQEKGPTITSVNTTSKTIEGQPNVLYPGTWAGPRRGAAELSASDPGVGLGGFEATSPNKAGWSPEGGRGSSPVICRGVQCSQSATMDWVWQGGLPSGEDTVEFGAKDGVGLAATKVSEKIKLDATLPYEITLSGLPANKELGNGLVTLKASAKDGSGTFSGSGIESLVLEVDGKAFGKPSGSCSPGPCTATGEWTVSGSEFPAGQHKIAVLATSYAGDVATGAEYTEDTGHAAVPVALGPGSVSPETGEFFLNTTDMSAGGPGATLSMKRSYSSSHLAAGAEGPLGPQWSMSVGGSEALTKGAEGTVVLIGGEGQQSVFTSKGKGEFTSPPLSASLTLTEVSEKEKTKEFLLKDASGQVTKFTLPSGGTGNTWVPSTLEGPGATNIVTYKFQTVAGVTEPTELLAPVPAGVSCTAELVKGCRALGFVYDTKTTAKGDGSSEWGEYEGRLKEVTFTAWEPTSGKMKSTAVADYVYDKEGKLRGEWNPSISPALETTYGYDAAGHVTALTAPGRQPWLFDYGTATGDPRARIVSVTRPSATTAAGNGVAPVNTLAPVLSRAEAMVGVPLSVSNGTWSNSPLSYSYQWETCSGETCSAIEGATSETYTPETAGVTLAVTVTATNAAGSIAATVHDKGRVLAGVSFKEVASFGKEGTASGQVKEPSAIAVESASGSAGDVWVADTGNNRIEKFTAGGTFVASYGTKGKENGQFEGPVGIALSETDQYVYVADSANKRIEVFEAANGKYVSQEKVGLTTARAPAGIASGNVFTFGGGPHLCIAIPSVNEVQCDNIEGDELGANNPFSSKSKEPIDVGISEEGRRYGEGNKVFVTSKGSHSVEIFEPDSEQVRYLGQFGSEGSGEGQFASPESIVLEPQSTAYPALNGRILISDSGNNRVQMSSTTGEGSFDWNFGAKRQSLALDEDSGANKGDLYVASAAASSSPRIAKWAPEAPQVKPPEPPNPGGSAVTTIDYHVPVSGSEAPYPIGKGEAETWGQKDNPTDATAIFPPDEPMSWPAKDYKRATIYYLDADARTVNVAHPGGGISTTEYSADGDVERTLSSDNRAAALKEGSKSAEVSKLLDTENTYNSEGTELQSTLGPQHNVELANGSQVQAREHKQLSYDEGAPTEGGPYGLPTKTTEGAEYSGKEEDVRETTTSYSGQENLGWKLHEPTSVTAAPKGLKLTRTTLYEPSTGEVKETVMPAGSPKEKTPHATETVYYSAAKNTLVPACGERAEWANLPCQTEPSKQPETSGLPNLPVTTITYNMWDEPERTTETVGSTTRTKTVTYDAAGRPKTSTISSSVGTALPTVTDEYNSETGALEKTSTTSEAKTRTLTSVVNKLGELTSYTDADENTSTYSYDIDGRLHEANDGKGTQTYTYDPTTGDPTKLVDSAAGTFTASYDAEGDLLSEIYPDGLSADYTYNAIGQPTSLQYEKTTHCAEKCTWFSDVAVPSIHGQWLSQTSTLSTQAYRYDEQGRLTQVQSTPGGGGCTTRIYAYDEDTNRTSLTTRPPGSKGECTSEGGAIEKHSYDSADRLIDTGTAYSTFGNITALPAADAGGPELTSAYYTDSQLASQTQNGETIGYNLDPGGRTRETVSTGKTSADIINHYDGGGDSPAWTTETPSGNWTRYIQGIGGGLAAIQANGTTPVLQLTDLHGDIIATAALSETETKLLSTTDSSEYGVPTTSTPAKYSWLGGEQQPTELPSGVIEMGARSYVPQLGRFLQTDPVPGGSANAYAYTFGDPVNSSDPSGELTYGFSGWLKEQNNQEAQAVVAREVAREALEREEAERRAAEAAAAAAAASASAAAAEAQEPLGGYPGWACEYAAETGQDDSACGGGEEEGSYSGGDSLHFITDKGGPGATCGSNSTEHKKCRKPKGGTEKENIETCGVLGGVVGGFLGGLAGDGPGAFAGGYGGGKAAEKACKAA